MKLNKIFVINAEGIKTEINGIKNATLDEEIVIDDCKMNEEITVGHYNLTINCEECKLIK